MAKSNVIYEYDKIAVDDDRKGNRDNDILYISKKQFDLLENFILSNQNDGENTTEVMRLQSKNGKKYAVACNYVGVITLADGTTIEILPKIGKTGKSDDDERRVRGLLIKMLRSLRTATYKINQSANIDVTRLPLFEVFIRMFIDEVYAIVRRGVRCGYETVSENSRFYKGKMLFNEQIKHNLVHKERFFVAYDEFNANRAENKLIKSTLRYLQQRSYSFANQSDLRALLSVFDEVSPSTDYDGDLRRSCRERGTEYYAEAIKWCGVFLAGKSFSMFAGGQYAKALLFPMEKLFESYVARELSKALGGEYSVTTQEQSLWLFESPAKFRLRPDIVVRGDGKTFILDTKWKLLSADSSKNYGISQGDMYQMYAYHKKYQAKKKAENIAGCFLLYPSIGTHIDIKPFFADNNGVNVNIFFVDLLGNKDSVTQSITQCMINLREKLIKLSAAKATSATL